MGKINQNNTVTREVTGLGAQLMISVGAQSMTVTWFVRQPESTSFKRSYKAVHVHNV